MLSRKRKFYRKAIIIEKYDFYICQLFCFEVFFLNDKNSQINTLFICNKEPTLFREM